MPEHIPYYVVELEKRLTAIITADRENALTRDAFRAEAIKTALAANDNRLETMNEFRKTLSDYTNTMITREESNAARDALESRLLQVVHDRYTQLSSQLDPVISAVERNSRTNWGLIISSVSIVFVLVTGVWVVISLKIDASLSPVLQALNVDRLAITSTTERLHSVELASAASTISDSGSISDRSQINSRLTALENSVTAGQADRRASTAQIKAELVEVETQFHAISDAINQEKDVQQQWLGLIWRRLYGVPLPTIRFRSQLYKGSGD